MSRPYVVLRRGAWASLANNTEIDLDKVTLERLHGLGDPTSAKDVAEIYRPLTQLLHLYIANAGQPRGESNRFLDLKVRRTPFVIGVAGSVVVGKLTTACPLREPLRRAPGNPKVDLVITDGPLLPSAELEKRGLVDRKGFPESYDRRALLQFVIDVKSGEPRVMAPVYSHIIYDIVPDRQTVIESPDILTVEGLSVLQPARADTHDRSGATVNDFFDFSVYVDTDEANIKRWFLERFMVLRDTAFHDPQSFFKCFTQLSRAEALQLDSHIWNTINGPNLRENIETTRDRATVTLCKSPDHRVQTIAIRKVWCLSLRWRDVS